MWVCRMKINFHFDTPAIYYRISVLCVVINVLKSVKSDGAAFLME